jgi:hypothetical protein
MQLNGTGFLRLTRVGALAAITDVLKENSTYVWAGVGVLALLFLLYGLLWLYRWYGLGKRARSLGFEHSWRDIYQLPEKCSFLPLFSKSNIRRIRSIYHGSREGVEMWMFDYFYKGMHGIRNFFRRQRATIVLFEMNYNFPFFYLRRERLADKLAAMVGHDDIDFSSNKKFSKKFYVKSANKEFANDLMTPEMIDFVLNRAGGEDIDIEMSRSLMAFHLDRLLYSKKLKWLFDFAWEFWEKTPETAVSRSR